MDFFPRLTAVETDKLCLSIPEAVCGSTISCTLNTNFAYLPLSLVLDKHRGGKAQSSHNWEDKSAISLKSNWIAFVVLYYVNKYCLKFLFIGAVNLRWSKFKCGLQLLSD